MTRSVFNAALCVVGVAIVVACGVLFVQCKQIVDDPIANDNHFARAVLDDAFRGLRPSRYPNGVTQADLGRVLYSRVSLYMLIGFAFIGAAWARQYGFWSPAERSTPKVPPDDS